MARAPKNEERENGKNLNRRNGFGQTKELEGFYNSHESLGGTHQSPKEVQGLCVSLTWLQKKEKSPRNPNFGHRHPMPTGELGVDASRRGEHFFRRNLCRKTIGGRPKSQLQG